MSASSGTLKLIGLVLFFLLLAWGTYWYFNYRIKALEITIEHSVKN